MLRSHALTALILLVGTAAGCGRKKAAVAHGGPDVLDTALAPATLAASLRSAGGGHAHVMAMFRVESSAKTDAKDGSKPLSPSAITTTTDLWMDRQGSFRLAESNDQDGGREIVRVAGEVAVALRYGKMIRRPAQDAENARFVAEAVGAPWALWEIVRRQVEVESVGASGFRFRLGSRRAALPPAFPATEGLRRWRDSVEVKALDGQATLDAAGKLAITFNGKTTFQAVRDDLSIEGEIVVTATLDDIGKVADIAMPEADTLHPRQRTILEERALLGGLGASLSPPDKKPTP